MASWRTHEVTNQPPPLEAYDPYAADAVLQEAVRREAGLRWHGVLARDGQALEDPVLWQAAELADRHGPRLRAYDRWGHRIDAVEFHPAWHEIMRGVIARGLHGHPWAEPAPGAHAARAAGFFMQGQVESGALCPATMTYAGSPLLAAEPAGGELDLARDWLPALRSRQYDAADAPASAKRGLLLGMGLTEKQGGSDLRGTTTVAEPDGAPGRGRGYRLTGHKWFYSVPQADAHLVLARAGDVLDCFLVPRRLPDGRLNAVRVRRLKDKLGNRSNASAEVEFEGAWGMLVGEPGRGIATLMTMAARTRLDCALGSAALLRRALVEALHHARHRRAFGAWLADQPLMRGVLADLALESEAATVLCLRLAGIADADCQGAGGRSTPGAAGQGEAAAAGQAADAPGREAAAWLLRLGTPVAKLWVCKRAGMAVAECMEVLGGNGYVEECALPRLYREAPVNSIWEGSGNVMALDVLRGLRAGGDVALAALRSELDPARGAHAAYDRALDGWLGEAGRAVAAPREAAGAAEAGARALAAGLARLWQAALLIRHAPDHVADAFVASRLRGGTAALAGEFAGCGDHRLLARAWPGG